MSVAAEGNIGWREKTVIALAAAAMLMQQILYTRLFSVTLFYHYAFLVIALSMLGIMLGGLLARYLLEALKEHGNASRVSGIAAQLCAAAACCTLIALFFQMHIRFLTQEGMLAIAGNALLLVPGFTLEGTAVALLLMHKPGNTARMYTADLCASGMGCLAVLGLLETAGVLGSLVLTSAMLAAAGVAGADRKTVRIAALFLLGAAAALMGGDWMMKRSGVPLLGIHYVRGEREGTPEYESWNSYSQVVVMPHAHDDSQREIIIDHKASTTMMRWDGTTESLIPLTAHISNAPYRMRPVRAALIIGVGGGRDVLAALAFGVKDITGVEMNRTTYHLLTQMYAPYAGYVHLQPGVRLINAEARSYLYQAEQRFDLIQLSMIDTWAVTAAGAFAMTENGLYTIETWREFLRKLTDNGMVSLTRWYHPVQHPAELYRMLALAREALRKEGISNPQAHVFAVRNKQKVTLVLSKSAITPAETENLGQMFKEQLILSPAYALKPEMIRMLEEKDVDEIEKNIRADLTPVSDDRPFFFNMVSLEQWLRSMSETAKPNKNGFNQQGVFYLMQLLALLLLAVVGILYAFSHFMRPCIPEAEKRSITFTAVYFALAGLGFMLVEMALLQKITLFLGDPSCALSVVLSTLLISGGIGSHYSRKLESRTQFKKAVGSVFLLLLLLACSVSSVLEAAQGFVFLGRLTLAMAMLIVCGVLMGMVLPAGLRYLEEDQLETRAAWLWAVNGGASVIASVLGMVVTLFLGISATLFCGALCYGGIFGVLCYRFSKKYALNAA